MLQCSSMSGKISTVYYMQSHKTKTKTNSKDKEEFLVRCCIWSIVGLFGTIIISSFLLVIFAIFKGTHSPSDPTWEDEFDWERSSIDQSMVGAGPLHLSGLMSNSRTRGSMRHDASDRQYSLENSAIDQFVSGRVSPFRSKLQINTVDWLLMGDNLPSQEVWSKEAISEQNTGKNAFIKQLSLNYFMQVREGRAICQKLSKTKSSFFFKKTETEINIFRNMSFTIEEMGLCNAKTVDLLIVVFSRVSHFDQRNLIRQTYGSMSLVREHSVRLIFILGMPSTFHASNNKLSQLVESESRIYRDIVQGNFIESWNNLTMSFNLALWWIGYQCPQTRFAVKVDDDTFLNVPHLLGFLDNRSSASKNNFTYCQVSRNRTPVRYKQSRWYISHQDYPEQYMPPHCLGFGFVTSIDQLPLILGCSLEHKPSEQPLQRFYDVYYTGIIRSQLKLPAPRQFSPGNGWTWLQGSYVEPSYASDQIFMVSRRSVVEPAIWRRLWQLTLSAMYSTS